MNEIMVAICDDSTADCTLLQGYLEKVEKELDRKFQVHICSTGDEFSKKISPIFDVVFLNPLMPDVQADEMMNKLLKRNSNVHLVFLSSAYNSDIASIGYEYGIQNYMLKPISYVMILNELKKYLKKESRLTEPFLWVSNRNGHFKIFHSRLRYVETENRHLVFHYEDQVIRHASRISNCIGNLPEAQFFRCNNSYIVNLLYISHIVPEGNRYCIHLITGEQLPLSRSRYRSLLSQLQALN